MKTLIFPLVFSLAAIAPLCRADEFSIWSEINTVTLDDLEFYINGRYFTKSSGFVGFNSTKGLYSKWFKAGTNTLEIRIGAPSGRQNPYIERRPESARIRFQYIRKSNKETVADVCFFDETFAVFPTNFQFAVTNDWPVKELLWESETPVLTDNDKAEILGILQSVADAYAQMPDPKAVEMRWNLEKYSLLQEALLNGIANDELQKQLNKSAAFISKNYGKKKAEFNGFQCEAVHGLNLARVTVVNGGNLGTKPLVAHRKDGSGNAMIGPEWFSKIDGKWWIVQ
jgi:hypothetical protein